MTKLKSLVLLTTLGLLSACSDSDKKPPPNDPVVSIPSVRFIDCPIDTSTSAALSGLRCGELDTYENYENTGPDAEIIQIAFGILPATDLPAMPDPVVVFVGGPGGSGLAELARTANTDFELGLLADNRDLIMVDQRGAGFSTPFLHCDGLLFPDSADDIDVMAATSCVDGFEQQGVDLTQYRSNVIAQDFKVLREALEIAQWNVYGASYGPIPGLLYAQLDPAGIRSVVFDSSTDNQVDIALADAAAPLNYITELARQCAEETECAARLPDLRSTFIDTFRALMMDPVIFVDEENGERIEIDGSKAVRVATEEELERRLDADLMHAAVQCAAIDAASFNDSVTPVVEPWPDDMLDVARASVSYPAICTSGIVSIEQDLSQRDPVSLDVPALVLGGGLDSLVSLDQVRKLTQSFVSPFVAIAPKGAHIIAYPPISACVDDIVTVFLDNPAEAPDMSCLASTSGLFEFPEE